jgi:hypothetical protein
MHSAIAPFPLQESDDAEMYEKNVNESVVLESNGPTSLIPLEVVLSHFHPSPTQITDSLDIQIKHET